MLVRMNYVQRTGKRPYYYSSSHDKDWVPIDTRDVQMHDGRSMELSIDREGFRLVASPSKVRDFDDPDQVARTYGPEIVDIVRAQTGADEVLPIGRSLHRFSERSGLAGSQDNSHPARFAHIDVSANDARKMIARQIPAGREPRRLAYFNAWRSLAGGVQDVPLGFCDSRTVSRDDCIEADARFEVDGGPPRLMESWAIAYNSRHRWMYFPEMSKDEIVIFKTFDSDDARARYVAHGAFDNPLSPADAPPRHSLETRVAAFWY